MERIYSPSPTVRSSAIPLYMRGWTLGQDVVDSGMIDMGSELTPPIDSTPPILAPIDVSTYDPSGSLVAPPDLPANEQIIANLYAGAVATGTITPAQAATQAAAAITAAARAATPGAAIRPSIGPSPRVATSPIKTPAILASQSIIKGIPDIALILGGGLLLFAAMGKR